jgi:hypothetical protein
VPDLPLQVIDAEVPPVGRRPAPPRARGLRGAVLAVVVAVVGLGIFGGTFSFGEPGPSPSGDPAACRPVEPGAPIPELHLGIVGSTAAVAGEPTGAHPPEPSPRWRLPDLDRAFAAEESDHLRLEPTLGACLREVVVEAGPAHPASPPLPAERAGIVEATFVTPVHEVAVESIPAGPWVVRALATWWTGDGGPDLRTEVFFRIHVGDAANLSGPATPTPEPAPLVTPAAGCGSFEGMAATTVVAAADGVEPVAGVEPEVGPSAIAIPAGAPLTIEIEGLACATSWAIELRSDDLVQSLDVQRNLEDDPGVAAQNRWTFVLSGGGVLTATLGFGSDGVIARSWAVTVPPFVPPQATLVEVDGTTHRTSAGCAISVFLANSYALAGACDTVPDEVATLSLSPGAVLAFDVPGWSLLSWHGACGAVVAGDLGASFQGAGCDLGGFTVTDGAAVPPARFLVPRVDAPTVLRFDATLSHAGDSVVAVYYIRIPAR